MYNNNEFNRHDPQEIYQRMQVQVPPTQSPQVQMAYTQDPPRRKRRRGNARAVLLCVMCLLIAASAGFAGGYLATTMNLASVYQEAPAPIYTQRMGDIEQSVIQPQPDEAMDLFVSGQEAEGLAGGNGSDLVVSAFSRPELTAAEVAAKARDSVVEIKTETVTVGMWGSQRTNVGAGSGVIISEDGYIITNDHVIRGTASIAVRLADGREFEAEVIAADAATDTAIIKINANGLSPAAFGDSDALVVGETALAVGNPLGELGGTVTGGIISATDRDIVLDGEIMTLLQTDAAVNPGNSGGGLFNMHGELIGVVVAKSGGIDIEGLGFAIPSNTAKQVAGDLLAYGHVRGRANVGVELVDINTTQLARHYGVNYLGLYILDSEHEELSRGDRIVAINNREITNQLSLNAALRHREVGDAVSMTVVRGGNEVSVEITLIEWRP